MNGMNITSVDGCYCNGGYYRYASYNATTSGSVNDNYCRACPADTYRVYNGTSQPSVIPSINECIACPVNTTTNGIAGTSVGSCVCKTGYTRMYLRQIVPT